MNPSWSCSTGYKESGGGQSGVARSSDSAMNTEDAGGIQKGKLPIIGRRELNSVGDLPWAQRAAIHLVLGQSLVMPSSVNSTWFW